MQCDALICIVASNIDKFCLASMPGMRIQMLGCPQHYIMASMHLHHGYCLTMTQLATRNVSKAFVLL